MSDGKQQLWLTKPEAVLLVIALRHFRADLADNTASDAHKTAGRVVSLSMAGLEARVASLHDEPADF